MVFLEGKESASVGGAIFAYLILSFYVFLPLRAKQSAARTRRRRPAQGIGRGGPTRADRSHLPGRRDQMGAGRTGEGPLCRGARGGCTRRGDAICATGAN